jgi:hypothetical protein
VCKQFRDDLLGPNAHVMWRDKGFQLRSNTSVTALTGLSLFLTRHIANIRPGYISKQHSRTLTLLYVRVPYPALYSYINPAS